MDEYTYIVICRDDSTSDDEPGEYTLATRQVFEKRDFAYHYANGIASSREAIVVEGRWHQLRTHQNAQDRLHYLAKLLRLKTRHEHIARFLDIQAEDECQALAMVETIDMGGGDEAFLRRYDVEV